MKFGANPSTERKLLEGMDEINNNSFTFLHLFGNMLTGQTKDVYWHMMT